MTDSQKKLKIKTPSSIAKATKLKWTLIGVGGLLIVIIMATNFGGGGMNVVTKEEKAALIDVTPGNVDKRMTERLQADLKTMSRTVKDLKDGYGSLTSTVEDYKSKIAQVSAENQTLRGEVTNLKKKDIETNFKMPPLPSDHVNGNVAKVMPTNLKTKVVPPPRPGVPYVNGNKFLVSQEEYSRQSNTDNSEVAISQIIEDDRPMIFKSSLKKKDTSTTNGLFEKNRYAGAIPPGSFADVALISGLDAGASEATRANPQPIFMRVQNDATLPGDLRYKLTSCFVLGVGYGDMSAERAYIQLSKITCVDKNNGSMVVAKLDGYVVDSDGTLGLRGKVERRAGALLGKAMLAGFAEGATQILTAAQNTIITTATGVETIIDPEDLGKAGLYGGASNSAKILAEQYIKEAKGMFPVVEIPAGRKATIMITELAQLEMFPYGDKYVREIKPEGVK